MKGVSRSVISVDEKGRARTHKKHSGRPAHAPTHAQQRLRFSRTPIPNASRESRVPEFRTRRHTSSDRPSPLHRSGPISPSLDAFLSRCFSAFDAVLLTRRVPARFRRSSSSALPMCFILGTPATAHVA